MRTPVSSTHYKKCMDELCTFTMQHNDLNTIPNPKQIDNNLDIKFEKFFGKKWYNLSLIYGILTPKTGDDKCGISVKLFRLLLHVKPDNLLKQISYIYLHIINIYMPEILNEINEYNDELAYTRDPAEAIIYQMTLNICHLVYYIIEFISHILIQDMNLCKLLNQMEEQEVYIASHMYKCYLTHTGIFKKKMNYK